MIEGFLQELIKKLNPAKKKEVLNHFIPLNYNKIFWELEDEFLWYIQDQTNLTVVEYEVIKSEDKFHFNSNNYFNGINHQQELSRKIIISLVLSPQILLGCAIKKARQSTENYGRKSFYHVRGDASFYIGIFIKFFKDYSIKKSKIYLQDCKPVKLIKLRGEELKVSFEVYTYELEKNFFLSRVDAECQ